MEAFDLGNNEYVELKNLLKLMGLCDSGGAAMAEHDSLLDVMRSK